MTLSEYRNRIFQEILSCSSKNEAINTLAKVERVLGDSSLSNEAKKSFWVGLYSDLKNASLPMFESQSSANLSEIVRAAQSVIAEKVSAGR